MTRPFTHHMDEKPTHLVAEAGDRRAICGQKNPLPNLLLRHVNAHRYQFPTCRACREGAGLAWAEPLPETGSLW